MSAKTTLHILTGKIASGKSSLAGRLGAAADTIVLSEDHLLSTIFEGDMNSVADYVRNSRRLRAGLEAHVVDLLQGGMSVVLDFAANTPEQRAWMRAIIQKSDCAHVLHYLDVPEEICRARLQARNTSGQHPFEVNEEQFDWITSHFVPPHEKEGFAVRRHVQAS